MIYGSSILCSAQSDSTLIVCRELILFDATFILYGFFRLLKELVFVVQNSLLVLSGSTLISVMRKPLHLSVIGKYLYAQLVHRVKSLLKTLSSTMHSLTIYIHIDTARPFSPALSNPYFAQSNFMGNVYVKIYGFQ